MIKFAALRLDFHDDDQCLIARELPPEYHELKIADAETIDALPDCAFALVVKTANGVRRRFPIHDADHIKLSEAYFRRTYEQLPPEAAKMAAAKLAAAKAGEAETEVAYVDLEKTSAPIADFPDRFYGLTIGHKNHYPLHDATLVKRAAARFPFTADGMDPQDQFMYARNIQKRASQLDVDLPESSRIHLYTNDELNLSALKEAVAQRKTAAAGVIGTEVLDQLEQTAKCALTQGPLESNDSFMLRQAKQASMEAVTPPQIVATLTQFDKAAGLGARDYARGLLDPFAACYKRAAYVGGSDLVVDGVDLRHIDLDELEKNFDAEMVKEFMANPVGVYKSLPDPVRSLIRQLAAPGGDSHDLPPADTTAIAKGDPTHELAPTFSNGNISLAE